MIVEASAPSNIALIKYMGKLDGQENIPSNSSLSWTLDELRTFVRITHQEDFKQDQWQGLQRADLETSQLSESGIKRYLQHFAFLKQEWKIEKCFLIESASNFPADCGLASSASSFAALTIAAVETFQKMARRDEIGIAEMADLSRRGSGSSCRSFFGPWVLWHKEGVRPLEFPMSTLLHQVVVVDGLKKEVSSSQAHRRVETSSLFKDRKDRAERRLVECVQALQSKDWRRLYETTWAEFWDMHALFETSSPPFGYMSSKSLEVLEVVKKMWSESSDGPVVTMDAGANVHFLWRSDQMEQIKKITQECSAKFRVFSSRKITEEINRIAK